MTIKNEPSRKLLTAAHAERIFVKFGDAITWVFPTDECRTWTVSRPNHLAELGLRAGRRLLSLTFKRSGRRVWNSNTKVRLSLPSSGLRC